MPEKTVAAAMEAVPPFVEMVPEEHRLTNSPLTTMQVNIGYRCNLACRHCHLSCGPKREEMMNREVMQACLDAYERNGFSAVDITGGAPEMHPDLEWFLREWQKRGVHSIYYAEMNRNAIKNNVIWAYTNPQIIGNEAEKIWGTTYQTEPLMTRAVFGKEI